MNLIMRLVDIKLQKKKTNYLQKSEGYSNFKQWIQVISSTKIKSNEKYGTFQKDKK